MTSYHNCSSLMLWHGMNANFRVSGLDYDCKRHPHLHHTSLIFDHCFSNIRPVIHYSVCYSLSI